MRYLLSTLLLLVGTATVVAGQEASAPRDDARQGGSSRLIWGPTGRMLAPGHTTVTTHQLFVVPVVQVGVTSRLQMGIGTPFFRGVLIAPKVQVLTRGKTAMAAGVAHVWMQGAGTGGFGYVATTYGTADAAVTVTGAMLYGDDERTPLLSVGGERRLSPRVVWITENHISRGGVVTSGGFRITGPNKTVDLALAWSITEQGVFPMPLLNIGWRY